MGHGARTAGGAAAHGARRSPGEHRRPPSGVRAHRSVLSCETAGSTARRGGGAEEQAQGDTPPEAWGQRACTGRTGASRAKAVGRRGRGEAAAGGGGQGGSRQPRATRDSLARPGGAGGLIRCTRAGREAAAGSRGPSELSGRGWDQSAAGSRHAHSQAGARQLTRRGAAAASPQRRGAMKREQCARRWPHRRNNGWMGRGGRSALDGRRTKGAQGAGRRTRRLVERGLSSN